VVTMEAKMPFPFNWQVELHPVMVHFVIGLLCFAFLLDVIGVLWRAQSARLAGLYCLIGGTVGTVLSVLSGKITPEAREQGEGEAIRRGGDFFARFFSGRRVNVHEHWGYVLLALVLLWLVMRVLAHLGKIRPGFAMSLGVLALVVLMITGYQGGELVYRRREGGSLTNTRTPVYIASSGLAGLSSSLTEGVRAGDGTNATPAPHRDTCTRPSRSIRSLTSIVSSVRTASLISLPSVSSTRPATRRSNFSTESSHVNGREGMPG
jgi:uncharacterized membrane protein